MQNVTLDEHYNNVATETNEEVMQDYKTRVHDLKIEIVTLNIMLKLRKLLN